ncbi:hypothetical protein C8F01DRAFT_1075457 [Mycena amicta]|nr:hypothetical protein C8F01DRAFT_1075457 [Mycena amicta]
MNRLRHRCHLDNHSHISKLSPLIAIDWSISNSGPSTKNVRNIIALEIGTSLAIHPLILRHFRRPAASSLRDWNNIYHLSSFAFLIYTHDTRSGNLTTWAPTRRLQHRNLTKEQANFKPTAKGNKNDCIDVLDVVNQVVSAVIALHITSDAGWSSACPFSKRWDVLSKTQHETSRIKLPFRQGAVSAMLRDCKADLANIQAPSQLLFSILQRVRLSPIHWSYREPKIQLQHPLAAPIHPEDRWLSPASWRTGHSVLRLVPAENLPPSHAHQLTSITLASEQASFRLSSTAVGDQDGELEPWQLGMAETSEPVGIANAIGPASAAAASVLGEYLTSSTTRARLPARVRIVGSWNTESNCKVG